MRAASMRDRRSDRLHGRAGARARRRRAPAEDLAEAGCEVRCEGRRARRETLAEPLEGVRRAYYLVHSMGRGREGDFAERDREGAENFAAAARGRGSTRSSTWAASRTEGLQAPGEPPRDAPATWESTGVPVTYLRAAAVIGAGSESFRTVFYLVKRLPAMVTPRWTRTRTQPIAIADVLAYLAQARGHEGRPGPRDRDRRPRRHDLRRDDGRGGAWRWSKRPRVEVPAFLTPRLSSSSGSAWSRRWTPRWPGR